MRYRLMAILLILLTCTIPVWAEEFLDKREFSITQAVDNFSLQSIKGDTFSLFDHSGEVVVFIFWSSNCPYIERYESRIRELVNEYAGQKVSFFGIASSITETPQKIKQVARERELDYDILLDPDHIIANKFGAVTTPQVFIVDPFGELVYDGAIDDQGWEIENPVTQQYVKNAIEDLLSGKSVQREITSAFGCTIKRNLD